MRWLVLLGLVACAPAPSAQQPAGALFLIRRGDIPGPVLGDCTRACAARVAAGYSPAEDCPHFMLEATLAGAIQDGKGRKLTCADVARASAWRKP